MLASYYPQRFYRPGVGVLSLINGLGVRGLGATAPGPYPLIQAPSTDPAVYVGTGGAVGSYIYNLNLQQAQQDANEINAEITAAGINSGYVTVDPNAFATYWNNFSGGPGVGTAPAESYFTIDGPINQFNYYVGQTAGAALPTVPTSIQQTDSLGQSMAGQAAVLAIYNAGLTSGATQSSQTSPTVGTPSSLINSTNVSSMLPTAYQAASSQTSLPGGSNQPAATQTVNATSPSGGSTTSGNTTDTSTTSTLTNLLTEADFLGMPNWIWGVAALGLMFMMGKH
jgi:hypothetical protein